MRASPRYFLIAAASRPRFAAAESGHENSAPPEAFAGFLENDFMNSLTENSAASILICAGAVGLTGLKGGMARLSRIISVLQARGIAVLVDDMALMKACGADGVHIKLDGASRNTNANATDEETAALTGLADVLKAVKPAGLAGAGGLTTRHLAMSAGEQEIDYVLFGEPDRAGHRPGLQAVEERTQWWSEIFTIPCVSYASDVAAIPTLARAGADFIGVEAELFESITNPQALLEKDEHTTGKARTGKAGKI